MKDYNRITIGYFECSHCNNGICEIPNSLCKDRLYCEIYNRLSEIQDKIERGEIDDVADRDNEIARLTAENAALQKRLENAVELPCKVGDTVYCILRISNPELKEWQVKEIKITDHNFILLLSQKGTKNCRSELSNFYNVWWFTDPIKAKYCLAELKGGRQE